MQTFGARLHGAVAQRGGHRLVVADDEPLVRRGLRTFIGGQPGLSLVGEARNGSEAVDIIKGLDAGARVVVEGPAARDGTVVNPKPFTPPDEER